MAARAASSWYWTSPACSFFICAEFIVACSLLNPSFTTFVFDSDVVFFCSNFTVSTAAPFMARCPFCIVPSGFFTIMLVISPSESGCVTWYSVMGSSKLSIEARNLF